MAQYIVVEIVGGLIIGDAKLCPSIDAANILFRDLINEQLVDDDTTWDEYTPLKGQRAALVEGNFTIDNWTVQRAALVG